MVWPYLLSQQISSQLWQLMGSLTVMCLAVLLTSIIKTPNEEISVGRLVFVLSVESKQSAVNEARLRHISFPNVQIITSNVESFLISKLICLCLQVPTPEIRAHSLYFDLSAYGVEALREHRNPTTKPGFHLKIYGTFRNRYMALVCPASDTKMVRFLRHTANSSVSLLSPFDKSFF